MTSFSASRRVAMASLLLSASHGRTWSQDNAHEVEMPFGWTEERIDGRKIYRRGNGARVVVLLHEINGLSPGCIDFGNELASNGFRVYMPLLFGHPGEHSSFVGGIQSCFFGGFKCNSPGGKIDTKPVIWVRNFVEHLCNRSDVTAVGVIGMCESGAFPLATMKKGSKVRAVVLSQPAIPFAKDRQSDAGIAPSTMQQAKESGTPILFFRFKEDTISTFARYDYLFKYFGPQQLEGHCLDGPSDFHPTWDHRLHAVLTGPFGKIREDARQTVMQFFKDKLMS
jgi:dienelactone hydrolase